MRQRRLERGELVGFVGLLLAIIFMLVLGSAAADVDNDPCGWEKAQAIAICRVLGPNSPECQEARHDVELCEAEHADNDPLEGATFLPVGRYGECADDPIDCPYPTAPVCFCPDEASYEGQCAWFCVERVSTLVCTTTCYPNPALGMEYCVTRCRETAV